MKPIGPTPIVQGRISRRAAKRVLKGLLWIVLALVLVCGFCAWNRSWACPKCGKWPFDDWHQTTEDCADEPWDYHTSSGVEHMHWYCPGCGYDWTVPVEDKR